MTSQSSLGTSTFGVVTRSSSCLVVSLVSALMRKDFVVEYEGLREFWPVRATEVGRGNRTCTGPTGVMRLGASSDM